MIIQTAKVCTPRHEGRVAIVILVSHHHGSDARDLLGKLDNLFGLSAVYHLLQ
jgi:hypothetical protein